MRFLARTFVALCLLAVVPVSHTGSAASATTITSSPQADRIRTERNSSRTNTDPLPCPVANRKLNSAKLPTRVRCECGRRSPRH